MKKLIFLLVMIMLGSCWGEASLDSILYEYKVVNQSDKLIKVEAYHRFEPTITPVVTTLYPDDTLIKRKKEDPPHIGSFGDFFGQGTFTDSLKVIFYGDTITKVQFYTDTCAHNELNPLDHCLYNQAKEFFVFTEEHFENAQPCPDCG